VSRDDPPRYPIGSKPFLKVQVADSDPAVVFGAQAVAIIFDGASKAASWVGSGNPCVAKTNAVVDTTGMTAGVKTERVQITSGSEVLLIDTQGIELY
jgi:hypothetical protein